MPADRRPSTLVRQPKRAVTFTNSIAASARGTSLDYRLGTIGRAEWTRRIADHQDGLMARGLAPLAAPFAPVSEPRWLSDLPTEEVRGTELRDGDVVYVCGRFQTLIVVTQEGDSFRTVTANGHGTARASSTYVRLVR